MARKRGNHEGTICKLPSGSWRAQITLDGHRMGKTFSTQRGAQDWIRKMNNQKSEGLSYIGLQFTISNFFSTWLANKKGSMRPGPWEQYERAFRQYINPSLGQIKLQELRTEHIQQFYTNLLDLNVGVPTIQKIHTILRSALSHAERLSLIIRNPIKGVIVPRAPIKEMRTLDETQVNRFIISLNGHRWEALYHLAFATGLRQMELLGLKWSDVDWVNHKIRIERQLERDLKEGPKFTPPKTKAGRRTIKLSLPTMEILQRHYEGQHELRRNAGDTWCEYDLVFSTNVGTPINHSNLRRDFNQHLVSAGLPKIRFHDIRHTAATLMINNGIPYKMVSEILGHARSSVTLDFYSHSDSAMQDKAAEVMGEILTPITIQNVSPGCTRLHTKSAQNQ